MAVQAEPQNILAGTVTSTDHRAVISRKKITIMTAMKILKMFMMNRIMMRGSEEKEIMKRNMKQVIQGAVMKKQVLAVVEEPPVAGEKVI